MKKKMVCLGLALLLGAGLSGCGGASGGNQVQEEDLATFKAIQKNVMDIKDAQVQVTSESSFTENDEKENASLSKLDADIKAVVRDEENMDLEIAVKEQTGGSKGTVYIKDGTVYLPADKEKVDVDSASGYIQIGMAQKLITAINEEDLQSIRQEKNGDGQSLSLDLNGETVQKALYSAAGLSEESGEMSKAGPMQMELQTDQRGQIKNVTLNGSYDLLSISETAKMNFQYQMKFISVNTGITIDFPDFSSYKEVGTEK